MITHVQTGNAKKENEKWKIKETKIGL